jgi:hypothetical protein
MSSVTRFLRQINTADQLVGAGTLATLAGLVYEFVPTTANYVGNYAPGAMVIGTTAASGIAGQIANALALAPNTGAVFILRDMGKTVYAGVASSEANAQTTPPSLAGTNYGWFRQYQLLLLNPITSNNFISGTTFGVNGTQSGGYTPYLTFYLPSAVAGIWPIASAQTSVLSQAAGGQL